MHCSYKCTAKHNKEDSSLLSVMIFDLAFINICSRSIAFKAMYATFVYVTPVLFPGSETKPIF